MVFFKGLFHHLQVVYTIPCYLSSLLVKNSKAGVGKRQKSQPPLAIKQKARPNRQGHRACPLTLAVGVPGLAKAVTQMYLHLAQSHIQIQHSKFSPVDRFHRKR